MKMDLKITHFRLTALSFVFYSVLVAGAAFASTPLPSAPTDPQDPGSAVYAYELERETLRIDGRTVELFLPRGLDAAPVIVFGKGQAMSARNYESTLVHLARKGIAVIFPQYDTGFFDQQWVRMGRDFASLTAKTLAERSSRLNESEVVFAGHSKGAYIALNAAALAQDVGVRPRGVVVFALAGFDASLIKKLPEDLALTLVMGEADTTVKPALTHDAYAGASARYRQKILVKNYRQTTPTLDAGHFFAASRSITGGSLEGPYLYYGVWRWLVGAVRQAQVGSIFPSAPDELFLYGDRALETGVPGFRHERSRTW